MTTTHAGRRASQGDHVLGRRERDCWEENGFVILEDFVPMDLLDLVDAEIERMIAFGSVLHPDMIVEYLEGERRGRHRLATLSPEEMRATAFRFNQAYLDSPAIRYAILHDRITAPLRELLGEDAVPFYSANFWKGSGRPAHADTWFMPPPEGGRMAVIWVALEDVHPDAGPLMYVPGSHRIPPYLYSTGGRYHVRAEMPLATAYLEREIDARGLERKRFHARRGDMFIWHEQLVHGGAERRNPDLTRRSMVVHYFNRASFPAESLRAVGRGKFYHYNPLNH